MGDESDELREELRRIAQPAEKRCAICTIPRTLHTQKEREGELHHQFSEQGELVHKSPDKPQASRTPVHADLALRVALIEAGVITYEKLASVEVRMSALARAGGRGTSEDGGDRSPESAERGDRGTTP